VKKTFKELHELFLATQFTAFMSDGNIRTELYQFTDIFFRHFTWFENYLIENKIEYNYDIDQIPIKVEKLSIMINDILRRIKSIEESLDICEDIELRDRVESDYKYIKEVLKRVPDSDVSSCFNANREYKDINLTTEARDSLTIFLFEESYKEYELIMVYNYSKANSSDAYLNRIFQILIDESFYHLRKFGEIMAEMGILAVPRMIMEEIYKFEDLEEFLANGIDEEINAKEECKRLSEAVSSSSDYFASFFEFINNQENYHIKLMENALKHIKN
jgi:rubrerythrin